MLTTFSTTMAVVALAAAWALASPTQLTCALAAPLDQIQQAPAESDLFVAAINHLRASKGLNALQVDGQLTSVATDWAVHMAQEDGISHRLDLRAGISALWKTLGENVGFGPSVSQLMSAFIASPGHYANLVDPRFTHIGVGTVRVGNELYTAHEFMALQGASTPVVTSPPVTSPPAPKVTTPRVTTPPTTAAPTTVPTTVPPTPTTLQATVVTELPADQQLHNGSQNDHQQEQSKSNGRCRSHKTNLQSIAVL